MPTLLVCVEGSASVDHASVCSEHFEADVASRDWTFRPAFVDQLDSVPVTAPEDLPAIRTVGAAMSLPEPEDAAVESAVRRDVTALIESMSNLARTAGIEFAVEYREEAIGFLDGGPSDARVLADFLGDP